jgi:hypothetical protein
MAWDAKRIEMKIALLMLCLLMALVTSAQIHNRSEKKVTILPTNISLEEALTILSISYGVQFSYSDDVVPTQTLINLTIQNENLDSALEKLLNPYGITYKITNNNRIVLRNNRRALTQTIRGTVTDYVTSAPIPGAAVILPGTEPLTGTTTDEHGRFKIDRVPTGRTSLAVSSIGYHPRTMNGVLLGTGKELVLDIQLSESVTPMREVVITALKNDGIPGDGVAITSSRSFSVEDTKRYAGSMGDPARMASAFAGVTGGSDENNALVVRGNSPRGVLWRVEGIEVPNPNHFAAEGASSGVVSVLSPNMIETSDFLTGAFPAQYGNALSAVFDIHLRNGNNEKREHSVQTGLLGLEASTEGPFNHRHQASYLVNYRYSTLSVLDKLGFSLNEAGQYKDYQDMSFKLNCPTQAGTFSLFGIGGKSRSNRTDKTLFDNNLSNVGVIGLTYKHRVNSKTFVNSSVSYSGTLISKYREVRGLDAGLLALEESYSKSYTRVSLSARRKITNRIFAEGGVTMSRLDYNFFLRSLDPGNPVYQVILNFGQKDRDHTNITQAFLYARQYFSSRLFGYYGFHFMHFALTHDRSFEPRLGLRWQFTPQKSFSVAYGKHSRIENLQYYLARDHQPGGNEVQINKDLGFTRANHIVLSYELAPSSAHRLKIETYYEQLYNAPVQTDPTSLYASINEDSGFITDSLINKGNGKNYGVEVSFEKSFSNNLYYLMNGSLFESTFTSGNQPEKNTAYNGNYSFHLLAGKEFETGNKRGRFGINLKVSQAGGRRYVPINLEKSIQEKRQIQNWDAAFDKQLPDYFRTDFQFVYRVNRHRYSSEWRLDIQNITNHRNAAYYYYDALTESIGLKKQIGFIPLLSYRIEF